MVEHIFRSENDSHSLTRGIEDMCALMPADWYGTLHEEIVRCRDCKHYNDQEPDGEIGTCELGLEDTGIVSIVEPNGFCSWAIRRDA